MRSLGVIFLADIVGYSKMMAQDEAGTLLKLREFSKDVIGPTLKKHQGTMIKSLGDGWLIEFNSASTAVSCALEWQSIVKQQGKMNMRVGIHLGDVEHEEGPPPDVYGDTVNIAARLESIAETGDVAISTSTYLCLDQNQAAVFNNCGKQTLKNIATPVEVWSTGRLNVGSKGMGGKESDKPAISIKPFKAGHEQLDQFCADLTNDLERTLNTKNWIESIVQKTPSDNDYQVIGTVSPSGPNFRVDVVLKAPGGKTLWNNSLGGPLNQRSQLSDRVADQLGEPILIEIMKVKDQYK